jgi:ribosomal-protein-alanine N-acetyltransferase
LVGDVAILVPSPGDDAWIGYSVHPENWGRGFASRAVALACQRLFEFGAARVRASVDPRNLRSITLLERIGFVQEAETNRIEVRGEIYDDAVYSLVASLRAVGTDGS